MVYHRILNRLPCVLQQDCVVSSSYIYELAFANPKHPVHPSSIPLSPLSNLKPLLYVCGSISVL